MASKTYKVNLRPQPTVPLCEAAAHIYGQPITEVKVLGPEEVEVITKRGSASGSRSELLPKDLDNLLKPAFRMADADPDEEEEVGDINKIQVEDTWGDEDKTYDSDSSCNPKIKPRPPGPMHPKEEAIRKVFERE